MSNYEVEPLTREIGSMPKAPSALSKALKSTSFMIGLGLLIIMLVFSYLIPLFIDADPYSVDSANRLMGPGPEHLLGTDNFGRDLLSRIAGGASTSIGLGFSVALCSGIAGTIIGILASYYSILDHILMRIADGLMAIPAILLAVALSAALGPSVQNTVIALSIVFTPNVARLVRSRAMAVKSEVFVEASQTMGARGSYIMFRHILPNTLSVLVVQMTFIFADSIITEAALSFLGAGVPAPAPSWGNILYDGKNVIVNSPYMVLFTSLALIITVIALNLLGDGLRDIVDRRSGQRKKKRGTASRLLGTSKRKQEA